MYNPKHSDYVYQLSLTDPCKVLKTSVYSQVLVCKLVTSAQMYFCSHLPQLHTQKPAKRGTRSVAFTTSAVQPASLSVALAPFDLNKCVVFSY